MYAISALVNALPSATTTTPEPSVASVVVPSHPVLGGLPVAYVGASINNSAVENQTRGKQVIISQSGLASESSGSATGTGAPVLGGYISGYPTLFLAQLMGQDPTSEQTFALIVTYQQMLDYGEIKYKPSNAGKPVEQGPMAAFLKALGQQVRDEIILPPPANINVPLPTVAANDQTIVLPQFAAPVQPTLPTLKNGTSESTQIAFPVDSADSGAKAYAASALLLVPEPSELLVA